MQLSICHDTFFTAHTPLRPSLVITTQYQHMPRSMLVFDFQRRVPVIDNYSI